MEAVVVDGREADDGDVVGAGRDVGRAARTEHLAQVPRRALERERRIRVRAEVEAQAAIPRAHDAVPEGARAGLQAAGEELVEAGIGVQRLLRLVRAAAGDGGERRDLRARTRRIVVAAHEGGGELRAEEDGPQRAAEQGLVREAQGAVAHDGLDHLLAGLPVDELNGPRHRTFAS